MDRNYIIDRIKSKQMSIEEFNFDKLSAPPLSAFLTPYDIADLRAIATSVKYASRPDIKLNMIRDVMNRRGLIKFAGGTNRVIYRHPEFNNIVFKVAIDNIGMGDNPAEFRNQWLLKPFVAKTFEISPCGTVAIQERVNPIKSREEFIYVAEDVYTLLTEWIIGKYIVADIGSSFFMNFGVRKGFGIVLLDYPYVYELDGNKLYCTAPNKNSPSGKCDGIIDYDDGFNFLHCTKCGAKYRAKELAKYVENKMITIGKEGKSKMKVRTSGGTGAINTVVNNTVIVNKEVNDNIVKANPAQDVPVRGSVRKVPTSSIITETVSRPVFNQEPVVEKVTEQKEVVNREPAKSPISFGDKIENPLNNKRSYVYEIEMALKTIKECFGMIQLEQVKDDIAIKIINTVSDIINPDIIIDTAMDRLDTYNKVDMSATYLDMNIDNLSGEDCLKFLRTSDIKNFISRYVDIKGAIEYNQDTNKYNMHLDIVGPNADLDDSETAVYRSIDIELEDNNDEDYVTEETVVEETPITKSEVKEEVVIVNEESTLDKIEVSRATYYAADIINLSTVDPNAQATDVIVIDDNQGGYLHDIDGSLIVIDRIQEKDVSEVSVVSKTWLDNVISETDIKEEETVMSEALKNINLKE